MRLLTLIQLSTAATSPILLLALPKAGSQPVNSSAPPKPSQTTQSQPGFRSAIAAPASSAAPSVARISPIAVPQFSFNPTPAPRQNTAQTESVAKPTPPFRTDFTWEQLVERSLPASLLSRSDASTTSKTTIAALDKVKASDPEVKQRQVSDKTAPLPTQALPLDNAALSDTPYVLGTGDSIQITVVNVPEFSGTQQVGTDGSIVMPVIGRVEIAGMSVSQAETAIAARLSRELRRPRILLTVLKSRPLRIGIAGEIRQPGFYTLSAADSIQAPSLVQAIQSAGGVTLAANLQQIEIRRRDREKGVQKILVNLADLAQSGDLSQNLSLRDGDSIYIPAAETVDLAAMGQLADTNLTTAGQTVNIALVGEVTRPGAYKIEAAKDAGRPTLTQAIQQAGGITSEADLRQVQVRRLTRSGKPQLITLNFWQLIRDGDLSQDLLLQPGDTIRLVKAPAMSAEDLIQQGAANISPTAIRVNVLGEVKGAGAVQVPANSTLNQVILAAGGLDRRAAKSVELIRLNSNGTVTRRSIQVDLSRGIDPANNPVLRNNDVIVVGRSGLAKFSDGVSDILGPFFRLLPLKLLF